MRQADLPMPAPRPRDVTLNIAKARRLGFAPAPAADDFAADYEAAEAAK